MKFRNYFRKKQSIWHKHFLPSLIAGLSVGIISYFYEVTTSNIILFASVGASAIILTHSSSHHLVKLNTTITAYTVTIVLSSLIYALNLLVPLHISINIFLVIFLVGNLLFVFNTFHPPAITAALSFILLEGSISDLFLLFSAILVLLVAVRFLTYVFSQHLSVRKFVKEFKKAH